MPDDRSPGRTAQPTLFDDGRPAPASPTDVLAAIQARLDSPPADLVADFLPRTREEAVGWARRLAAWDEYRDRFPGRAVALARLVSRRAMREHGLEVTADGRVADRSPTRAREPEASLTFPLLGGEVRAEYTPGYFRGQDHFQFRSPHDPVRPMPLSEGGWWSHFADADAVEACGGPEAYAGLYADAELQGRAREFEAAFQGALPESGRPRRAARRPRPGGSGGAAGETPNDSGPPPGRLF
ncbi:MAG: hypothetical protein C0501_26475 [Isosphaera sp.]|nr:hypothetical protein [Isosphaera sp.]